jgi:hypothetical protein
VQPVPCRWANTKPAVVSGARTLAGRREHGAHLAGRSSDRQNACGEGSAGPVPDGPGETARAAAGTRHQTWLVHVWVSSGERTIEDGMTRSRGQKGQGDTWMLLSERSTVVCGSLGSGEARRKPSLVVPAPFVALTAPSTSPGVPRRVETPVERRALA